MSKMVAGLLIWGVWHLQAHAGLFDDDEARRQIAM